MHARGWYKEQMRVVSFDIGIRNLAYCVVSHDTSTMQKMTLERWNVVDLLAVKGTMYDDSVSHILCKSWKVAELREWLRQRGESTDGKSRQLVDRISAYMKRQKIPRTNAFDMSMLGSKLYVYLDRCAWLDQCDVALIENQPSLTNPRMKSVQMLLYGYLLKRCQLTPCHDERDDCVV